MARLLHPSPLGYRQCALSSRERSDCVYIEWMDLMQSHGLQTKYLSNVQNSWLIRRKRTQIQFLKTPTCQKLLCKCLHLDGDIRQNDTAVDQSTSMVDDMHSNVLLCCCVLPCTIYNLKWQFIILAIRSLINLHNQCRDCDRIISLLLLAFLFPFALNSFSSTVLAAVVGNPVQLQFATTHFWIFMKFCMSTTSKIWSISDISDIFMRISQNFNEIFIFEVNYKINRLQENGMIHQVLNVMLGLVISQKA